jgi:hypothetical protein
MSSIGDLSIFGTYSQKENRVTSALLHILKIGGTEFIAQVIAELDDIDFPDHEINVITQEREDANVYDGLLECNFAFRVLIESKIEPEAINQKQLEGLLKNAKSPTDYIIYITTDNKKPKELDNLSNVYWSNWKTILQILKTKSEFSNDILKFLIKEFEKFLDNLNLLYTISDDERVQIAAGKSGEPIALTYGFYACQNNRSIKNSRYLAFYNNQGIHTLFEIIGTPINDYNLLENPDLKEYIEKYEPNYSMEERRQFYKIKLLRDDLTIGNDLLNKNGKSTPFTMGVFRYTTINTLLNANTTSQLIITE